MARLTAAAGLALAILLMCVALGAAQSRGDQLAALFPKGSVPPPVKIYCKQNPGLNIAVRDGKVVLAPHDCNDPSQKWILTQSPASSSRPLPFSLLNAEAFQVIMIPSRSGDKLTLSSPTNSGTAILQQLWRPGKKSTTNEYYQLFVDKRTTLSLNALGGARDGAELGVSTAQQNPWNNALWRIEPMPTLCV